MMTEMEVSSKFLIYLFSIKLKLNEGGGVGGEREGWERRGGKWYKCENFLLSLKRSIFGVFLKIFIYLYHYYD